jgi:HME family heavy-metal exporter
MDHMLSGIRAEVALKIYGDDLDTLRNLAETLRGRLTSVKGLADLQVEKQNRIPQLRVEADYDRARLYGVTPAALTGALEGMSNGRVVSQVVTEGNRRFDVVIRLSDKDRSTTGLADLLIETPSGHVPLQLVAKIQETDGPNQILRENGQRRIAVYANSDGSRDRAEIVADIRGVLAETQWPQGYSATLEGTYQAYEDAAARIGVLALASVLLIFLVLQSRYRSAVLALIIMVNIPLALIGSVAALWIVGLPLSVASMMGFVTLAGISARNGILKISRYINLALHEGKSFGPDLVVRGSLDRLAPVALTALSAGLALTPLLIGATEPGREILHPVAVTIFGGLSSSTLFDAVLTPALFLAFGRKPLERLSAERRGALASVEIY